MYDCHMDKSESLFDQLKLVESLYTVALESQESEIVRVAFAALVNTEAGRAYLASHPVAVG